MRLQRLITVFSLLVLVGCATPPSRAPTAAALAAATANSEREALARQLIDKNHLAEALIQWNILCTINPESESYCNQAHALHERINAEVEHHLAIGLADLSQGAYDSARLSFLKILALDPRRRDVLTYLREIDEQLEKSKPSSGMTYSSYRKGKNKANSISRFR
jgi:tetratricopeptide (TPR) repeat protein